MHLFAVLGMSSCSGGPATDSLFVSLYGDDELGEIERLRDARLTAQRRIFEDQYPPLGFLCTDQASRCHDVIPDLRVVPCSRDSRAARTWRRHRAEHFPKRREVIATD